MTPSLALALDMRMKLPWVAAGVVQMVSTSVVVVIGGD